MAGSNEGDLPDSRADDDIFDGAGTEDETPVRPRRTRRGLRIAVVSLVTVALLAVGAVAGYLAFLNWRVSSNITHAQLLPESPYPGEDSLVTPAPPEKPASAGDALNILVIGSDSRDIDSDRGRSDVMVLMHVSDERDRVDLIHFPRDLFVQIPGSERKNKLNASYAFGGPPLLVETLQPLIGVPVDHVVITDFESFKSLTDAVGGVDVNVTQASPGFDIGVRHMDGETGLRFVRERYALSQGDISRGERQQEFIKAVMLKVLTRDTFTNPSRLANVVDAATENLTVDEDLQVSTMRDLGWNLRNLRGDDIHFVTAPWSGIGSDSLAGSIVIPHEAQFEVLREHLQTDTMEDYRDEVSPQEGFGG
ncbi:LytR family transcriptional regulator [Ornithinimicrobium ciconiae]|uniref:LytR family transcriptional regulator n=1 Tax=Ornithinimicrobium ciconiae TaxID=2594265 RepID=A0A516G826_9MICO|nr:LCP family protein [Ornithinimicrobium ciconiae]QDO87632.1 LytR family transcriptional regulator [Ornithinimicrobium ciconiae]